MSSVTNADACVGVPTTPLHTRAGMLSPGELQRLSIARALHHRPLLALLDEPISAVSPAVGRRLLHALRQAGVSLVTFGQEDSAALHDTHDLVFGLGGARTDRTLRFEQSCSTSVPESEHRVPTP